MQVEDHQHEEEQYSIGATEESVSIDYPVRQAGILNLGNTGYMDVILQHFYMNKRFLKFILSIDVSSLEKKSKLNEGVQLIKELQQMFRHLQTAENLPSEAETALHIQHDGLREAFPLIRHMIIPDGSYDPTHLVKAVDNSMRLWRPVLQPNDSSEFLWRFLDKIERTLASVDYSEGKKRLRELTGIPKVTEWMCSNCQNQKRFCRVERFVSVPIRSYPNLTFAAQKLLQHKQLMSSSRCTGCKTQSAFHGLNYYEELPHMLAFRLERWTKDINGQSVKLNDRFEFHDTLDLVHSHEEQENSAKEESSKSQCKNLKKVLGIRRHGPKEKDKNKDIKPLEETLKYRLSGVVVHRGTAKGGRYFCFIKDRSLASRTSRWIRFWGTSVTPATYKTVKEESFGGLIEDGVSTNAYLVFYEKLLE